MKDLKWYGMLALVVILAYLGLTRWFAGQVTQEHEARFNELQLLQTKLSARSIEDHFEWLLSEIATLATYYLPNRLAQSDAHDSLEELFRVNAQQSYPAEELFIVYADANGDSVAQYNALPDLESTEAEMLLAQWLDAYAATARENGGAYITPFYIAPDAQFCAVLHPVYSETATYAGTLIVLLDLTPVLEKYVAPMRSGDYGYAWVRTTDDYLLYHPDPELIGASLRAIAEPHPDLQAVNQRFMTEERGTGAYHFTIEYGGEVDRKLVAWSNVHLANQQLTLALAAPEDEINAELRMHRRTMQWLGLLLGFTLIVSSGLYYATRQRALERLVAQRTRELKDLNIDLEARVAIRTSELATANAELTTILETMSDGVIFRRDGQIIYSNTAVTRLFGFTPDELANDPRGVQQQVTKHIPPPRLEHIQRAFQRTLRQNGIHRENLKLTRKDGQTLYASVYMAPIIAPNGERFGTLEIIHDISHEIALQEQKDRFITNASHELRRPLSNLKTRLYLLRHQPNDFEAHMTVLERATEDMSALVRDLVDVAQFTRDIAQLERQPVQLQRVLDAAKPLVDIAAQQQNIPVHTTIPAVPITITGDYQRLTQAFANLITHAVNASPESAPVYVNLTTESGTNIMWGVLRVHGREPHLDSSGLVHIFDPFYRPSEGAVQSTGLGLTLAHLIIEAHGGTIEATNAPSGGIVYTVRLPFNPKRHQTT